MPDSNHKNSVRHPDQDAGQDPEIARRFENVPPTPMQSSMRARRLLRH